MGQELDVTDEEGNVEVCFHASFLCRLQKSQGTWGTVTERPITPRSSQKTLSQPSCFQHHLLGDHSSQEESRPCLVLLVWSISQGKAKIFPLIPFHTGNKLKQPDYHSAPTQVIVNKVSLEVDPRSKIKRDQVERNNPFAFISIG